MPRGVAKAKDGGVDREKSVVKKVGVKKDGVKRGRKMRGGGLLQHIISALENKSLVYDDIFDNINNEFDKIVHDLQKKKESIPSKAFTNTAKNTHMEHIRQIGKFKLKDIKNIPSLLDLKNLLEYIKTIVDNSDIDITILYTNIIILYIYNFFELIKDIIENNAAAADIEVKDTPATPAASPAPAPALALAPAATAVSSPVIETDTAILARMKQKYDIHKLVFSEISADKKIIYARVISVIQTMTSINSVDYTKYDLKTYLNSKNNYIKEILTKYIKNIKNKIQNIKTSTKSELFNAIYINDLEKEINEFDNIIKAWLSSILTIIT
jgi:hypothetical protein